jgi:hypothetical protein
MSLMGKYRFRGVWPNASIYCHGIYIGFELLAVGDTVRLLPSTKSTQIDIMSIKSIRLKWSNLDKASNNDYDEGRPYNSEIWIYGSAYTRDASRSNKLWLSDANVEPPKGAAEYAEWHPLHPSDKELGVPYSRVLGRLYERHAMAFFFNSGPEAEDLQELDLGRQGMEEARAYARQHDQRIAQEPNATWYWADDRADALDIQTINGLDVAKFDLERDVKDLRKKMKLLDGITNEKLQSDNKSAAAVALPVRTNNPRGLSVSGSSASTSSDSERCMIGEKRAHIADLGDDEIEDEIREHTRLIVEDVPTAKKARVMVIID